jgi:hypothetical protein
MSGKLVSEKGYTPDTEYVRGAYAGSQIDHHFVVKPEYGAEFDRWLAEHDAETRQEAIIEFSDSAARILSHYARRLGEGIYDENSE